jgi:ferritin-like metal-binding protein YciE
MGLTSYEDVLFHEMKDLLSAEKQFRDALTQLAKAADHADLQAAFEEHRRETETQIERLEKGFRLLGRAERSEKCEAAAGLVAEGRSMMEEGGDAPFKDIGLAGGGRKVEHYEIVSYMSAVEHAKALGHTELAQLLNETLAEERAADQKLERIAKSLGASALRAA